MKILTRNKRRQKVETSVRIKGNDDWSVIDISREVERARQYVTSTQEEFVARTKKAAQLMADKDIPTLMAGRR